MNNVSRVVIPALITFGPLVLAIAGGRGTDPSPAWLYLSITSYAGALGLSLALVIMFRSLISQQKEIRQLRRALAERPAG